MYLGLYNRVTEMELSLPAVRAPWSRAIFFFTGLLPSVDPQGSHSQPRAKEEKTRSTPRPRRAGSWPRTLTLPTGQNYHRATAVSETGGPGSHELEEKVLTNRCHWSHSELSFHICKMRPMMQEI